MYAPKRLAFTFGGMKARSKLAAIDHNHHLHRPYATDENGQQCITRRWSKRAKRWKVVLIKDTKEYSYILILQSLVLQSRSEEKGRVHLRRVIPDSDPRWILPTIASVPAKSSKELHQEALTHF